MGLFEKVGTYTNPVYELPLMFRMSSDYRNPTIQFSKEWYVWKVGEKMRYVGVPTGEEVGYPIGVVVAPHDVKERMFTGVDAFVYPDIFTLQTY